jgi:hypothetical protein
MESIYQQSKIYRLLSEDGHYYIGSTTQPLHQRLHNHKQLSKLGVNKVYEFINQIGWDKITIELIEDYPCHSKNELNVREKEYIIKSKGDELCLNFNTVNRYKNGKIYRILCIDGHYYYGSTVQQLNERLSTHKKLSKTDNTVLYNHINTIGWDNAIMELVEEYPCETTQQLHAKEDEYITRSKDDPLCLNVNRAYVSQDEKKERMKEYYEENKNAILVQSTKYREENREEILERKARYREKNREVLREKQKEYVQQNIEGVHEARKKHYEEHKEQYAIYNKEYRKTHQQEIQAKKAEWNKKKKEENAEQIAKEREAALQKRKEKSDARIKKDRDVHTCECGGTYQLYRKSRHDISKKHTEFVNAHV